MTLTPELIEFLIRAAVTLGEEVAIAILHAMHANDVSAVEQLTAVLPDEQKILLAGAMNRAQQHAKAAALAAARGTP